MNIQTTRREACDLIRASIGGEHPMGDKLNKIVFAANNDSQVRDYLMGLPEYYDMQDIISFMCHMCNESESSQDAPFWTVAAIMAYETGEDSIAKRCLARVKKSHPDYSLANLLRRVISSKWPRGSFAIMRKDLAIKVSENCYGKEADDIILEGGMDA